MSASRMMVVMFTALISQRLHAEEVSIKQISEAWKRTDIPEIVCEFELENLTTPVDDAPPSDSPFGEPKAATDRILERFDVRFARNEKLGFYISQLNRSTGSANFTNNLNSSGVSLSRLATGEQSAIISPPGGDGVVSLSLVSNLLFWVNPLATKDGTRIAGLSSAKFELINHPDHGNIIQVEIAGDRELQAQFSKDREWRPILKRTWNKKTKMRSEVIYKYSKDTVGHPKLLSMQMRSINSQSTLSSIAVFRSIAFRCDSSDLDIQIPDNTLVEDFTNGEPEPRTYVKLKGESTRIVTNEEMRKSKSMKQIIETDPSLEMSKPDGSLLNQLMFILGVGLVVIGVVIVCVQKLRAK